MKDVVFPSEPDPEQDSSDEDFEPDPSGEESEEEFEPDSSEEEELESESEPSPWKYWAVGFLIVVVVAGVACLVKRQSFEVRDATLEPLYNFLAFIAGLAGVALLTALCVFASGFCLILGAILAPLLIPLSIFALALVVLSN